jgi:ribulose-5-phosphate 4-epimerase/fuculose-1-phosphate aldolase
VSEMGSDPRTIVSLGCRVLGSEDQGDLIWGHVSMRDPHGRGVWMKAASFGFEEIEPDRVILIDDDGNVIEGTGRRHIEFPIHTEVMAARRNIGSVVHTHGPHAVAFAALDQPLLPISHEGTLFIPPDIARFTDTGDLIMTRELGAKVAEALGERNALLLVNHGIVTVGPDVPTAVLTAILLERACRTQLLAARGGRIAKWSSDDEALAKREHCYSPALLHQAWDYLVRRLDE